jgi:hypothetical protein
MTLIVAELRAALAKANVPDDLAEAAARAVVPRETVADLATKADLTADIAGVRAEIEAVRLGLEAKIEALRSDLHRTLWIQAGVIVGGVGALIALFKAV